MNPIRTVFLHTPRCQLVTFTEADATITHHWFNDPMVNQFLSFGGFPMLTEDAATYYKNAYADKTKLILGVVLTESNTLIGTVGLHGIDPINRTAELGVVIGDRNHHEKGLGTEVIANVVHHAFQRIGLRRVTLRVLGNNARAMHCYRRLGFIETGRFPEHIYKEGAFVDDVHMLLTKERFMEVATTEACVQAALPHRD